MTLKLRHYRNLYSFTQGNSGSSHDYLGKKVRESANPSCDNQSDVLSSRWIETTPKNMLQGSGFNRGDIAGDVPHL